MGFIYQLCKLLGIDVQGKKKEQLQEEIIEKLTEVVNGE